ncbi:MAG: NAD(P)-dependent oxidoreductase [Alphaproteobacteria bacterium]|nr:NAD(P)-dependent oxidoreductase [Alphaproteobacteria bacterium]
MRSRSGRGKLSVLVTGGTGFLGLNLAEHLLTRGQRVVIHGHVPPPPAAVAEFARLPGRLVVARGDVGDAAGLATLMRAEGVTRMVHAAAITPDAARERCDPARILTVNAVGTVHALQAAREAKLARVIVMSSGSVYGRAEVGRDHLDEALVPEPEFIYGIAKFAGERAALRLASLWGLDLTVIRLGPLFGRWEWATGVRDMLSTPTRLAEAALRGGAAVLPSAGAFDWLYTEDAARGVACILDAASAPEGVYNLGSGRVWPVADWAARLAAQYPAFRWSLATEHSAATVRYFTPFRPPLATMRMRRDFGFAAACGLDEAFADYLPWIAAHPLPR